MTRGNTCLVPRPYYSARPKRFGSRGAGEKCETQAKIFKTETAHAVGLIYKTSVSHLKVKNKPLKHTHGKGKFKRMLSFLLVENGRLFFTKSSFEKFESHEIFITADQSAWPVLKRNQAAKFLKNFQLHFVLYRSFSPSRNKKQIGNRPVEEAKKNEML